jgi:uncharacterized membrane protein YraQ (UPF0718 family)
VTSTAQRDSGQGGLAPQTGPIPAPPPGSKPRRRYRPGALEIFGLVLAAGLVLRGPLEHLLAPGAAETWTTIFVAVCVQATPFLVLGVVVSGAIAAYVPASFFTRILPRRPALAVPVAGACGFALPGCECGSVPIANRLMDRGVRPSAALAFLLSAPAINPIVLVATAVAFQSDPRMAWARLAAGLLTAVLVGLIWEKFGRPEWLRPMMSRIPEPRGGRSRAVVFLDTVRGDFTQAAGFLVIGAAAAATLNVVIPREKMTAIGSSLWLSIILMGLLAFILAICSEADAFVAASFTPIPMVAKLVFLTVGPAVDVKLVAMQTGTFGRRFATRFAPLTFTVAVLVGTSVGLLVWGV